MGSEGQSGSPRGRLPEFLAGDPIRGIGVLAVITAHVSLLTLHQSSTSFGGTLTATGSFALALFFGLSGYLIAPVRIRRGQRLEVASHLLIRPQPRAPAYGKPVIATGYSGNLTFMDDGNSYLVPYSLVHVPPRCEPYLTDALWAEPDLDSAAALMRHVFEKPGEARQRGLRAQSDIQLLHSADRTAQFMANRLEEIHGRSPGADRPETRLARAILRRGDH